MHLDKIQLGKGGLRKKHALLVLGLALLDSSTWNPASTASGKFNSYWKPGVTEEAPMYQSHNRNASENTFIEKKK